MELQVQSLGQEDLLEKEMTANSLFLPGKSHGQKRLAGSCPCGCRSVGHDLADKQQQNYSLILISMSFLNLFELLHQTGKSVLGMFLESSLTFDFNPLIKDFWVQLFNHLETQPILSSIFLQTQCYYELTGQYSVIVQTHPFYCLFLIY